MESPVMPVTSGFTVNPICSNQVESVEAVHSPDLGSASLGVGVDGKGVAVGGTGVAVGVSCIGVGVAVGPAQPTNCDAASTRPIIHCSDFQ